MRRNKAMLRAGYGLAELFRHRTLYLMTLPAVAFFFVFSYMPMVGIYYAFTNFNYIGGLFGSPFVGLRNFRYLFNGGLRAPVWNLIKNTVLYNVAFIFIGNALQCFLAVLLSEMTARRFKRVAQSTILLPHFISYVIVGAIAYNLFSYEFGAVNATLKALSIESVNLYAMPAAWPFIIVAFNLWKGVGYGSVVYLAAIMGLDRDIFEAARIDGCNVVQVIRFITLPLLKTTFTMLVLFSLGGIMRGQFELFYQLVGRNGQLFPVTDILDTYIYRALTINFNIGLSTAAGLFQSVFGLVTVLAANMLIRRANPENALF